MSNTVKTGRPILDVKDLRISFTTINGTVKAVRGISFSLYRGRTLAIVGESGSGKSVSSKAIMGLLAGNKIIEHGQILFDGMDLLKLSDDEFVQIRGSRISMIFQDPMSSLNPIMRVGKQLTEAMVLKNASTRKLAKKHKKHLSNALANYKSEEDINKIVDELIFVPIKEANKNKIISDKQVSKIAALEEKKAKAKKPEILEKGIAELKAGHEEFVANHVLAYEIKAEDLERLHSLFVPVTKFYFDETIHNRELARNYLSNLESLYFPEGQISLVNMKKSFKELRDTLKACLNPVHVAVDSFIATYFLQMKALYKKYIKVSKKVIKDAKLEEKLRIKEEKGKDTSSERLKIRSFSSEIVNTPETVIDEIKELINSGIAHLQDVLKRAHYDEEKEAKLLTDSLFKVSIDSLARISKYEAKQKAISLLDEVGIPQPDKRFRQYPFELSGGMRQRVVIAIALASNPEILICDEPTTALDVTIQAQILELINKIKKERNLSIIFITHNLGVVANMADDIAVMYAGKIVEYADVYDLFYDPRHPYTWALLASMPDLNTKERLHPIKGTPPNMILPPKGDAFAPRNEFALKIDFEKEPPLFKVAENHYVASWLVAPNAPKVEIPKIVTERIRVMKKRGGKVNE